MSTWLRLLVLTTSLLFPSLANSGEQIGQYPSGIFPLKEGVLICLSEQNVVGYFDAHKIAFETNSPPHYPNECRMTRTIVLATVSFVSSYEGEYVRADVLHFNFYVEVGPGLYSWIDSYYGFGNQTPTMKALHKTENI